MMQGLSGRSLRTGARCRLSEACRHAPAQAEGRLRPGAAAAAPSKGPRRGPGPTAAVDSESDSCPESDGVEGEGRRGVNLNHDAIS